MQLLIHVLEALMTGPSLGCPASQLLAPELCPLRPSHDAAPSLGLPAPAVEAAEPCLPLSTAGKLQSEYR